MNEHICVVVFLTDYTHTRRWMKILNRVEHMQSTRTVFGVLYNICENYLKFVSAVLTQSFCLLEESLEL